MPSGCWRSWPFGQSRPPRPKVAVIPGTSAGRWLCPWPTQIVNPMTLAPKTGKVSWGSMGLRRVLFLAEIDSYPSKSQDLSFGSNVVDLEVKSRGILPAISGRAGSRTESARGYSTAASRHLAPRNLSLSKFGATLPLASVSQCNVPSPAGVWTLAAIMMVLFSQNVTWCASVARPIKTSCAGRSI
jgi:hypothetical protein